MVVPVHSHGRELFDLIRAEHAQRAGDVNVDLVADRLDAGRDLAAHDIVQLSLACRLVAQDRNWGNLLNKTYELRS